MMKEGELLMNGDVKSVEETWWMNMMMKLGGDVGWGWKIGTWMCAMMMPTKEGAQWYISLEEG